MSHDYGGPKFDKIFKHEQPGTGFWPIIPITIWHQDNCGENYNLDLKGLLVGLSQQMIYHENQTGSLYKSVHTKRL